MILKSITAFFFATMILSPLAHAERIHQEGTFCGTIVETGVTLSGSHGPMSTTRTSLRLAGTDAALEVIFFLDASDPVPAKYKTIDAHFEARKIIGKLHPGAACIEGVISTVQPSASPSEGSGGWIFPVKARQDKDLQSAFAEETKADQDLDSASAQ